jgi:hypothetical protein
MQFFDAFYGLTALKILLTVAELNPVSLDSFLQLHAPPPFSGVEAARLTTNPFFSGAITEGLPLLLLSLSPSKPACL